MNILALEPYYGGSHKYFLDNWKKRSRHNFTVLKLPAYKWKWRMRHAALTFADELCKNRYQKKNFDLIFCSDMLDLASFKGLAPENIRKLPTVIYFHENQLTYPVFKETERDYQYVFTNFTSALAAEQVWFNSAFNRDSFINNLPVFLRKMPDFQPVIKVENIREKSKIMPIGIKKFAKRPKIRNSGPIRILWSGRWEHDKNPDDFFKALSIIKSKKCEFRLIVTGESFREIPGIFKQAEHKFQDEIDVWGYLPNRKSYLQVLKDADIIVSTAIHEFFGIGVLEAVSAGAFPVLPNRLVYPEIFKDSESKLYKEFFYGQTAKELANTIMALATKITDHKNIWQKVSLDNIKLISRFYWRNVVSQLDKEIEF